MLSCSLITVALAGAATAFTPPGFQPASTQDLAVGFNGGAIKAMNGVNLPQADTTAPPEIGTPQKMSGTYTLLMVDADIPPSTPGGSTSELLHWMQPGLVSAATTSTIAGQKVFALTNPTNTSALATYIAPNPPNIAPTSHRYVQMLLNTTGLVGANMTMLMKEAATRTNFNAANVLKANGLTVLMGNSFNVTNAAALESTGASNSTGQGVAGGTAGGATGGTTKTTAKTTSAAAAEPKGSANGINSATLTTDALLKPGYNATGAPSTPTSAAAAETPKATGPINSATLTTDVLISTGGAQQAGVAATTAASASSASNGTFKGAAETHGVGYLLAGVGAFAAAVVVL